MMLCAVLKPARLKAYPKTGNMIMAVLRLANAVSFHRKSPCRMKTLIRVDVCRNVKDKETRETRYYISDEECMSAAYYNALVRGHWGIGNHLHRYLDVTFKEDASRAR
jgi:predicted transposase YbfD/YdcC